MTGYERRKLQRGRLGGRNAANLWLLLRAGRTNGFIMRAGGAGLLTLSGR